MQEINFDWIRGDDETETLIFTDDDNAPVDFTDCHFDCDIVPVNKGERIRLSSTNGSVSVKNNEVTLIISHDKTEQVDWVQAKWEEFVRFIEYMVDDKVHNWQNFDNAQRIVVNASASYSGKYEDNMVYKF